MMFVLVLVTALVGAASPLQAQQAPLLVDARAGVAVPVGSFSDGSAIGQGAEAGASLAVAFVLRRSRRRALYFGFTQHRFGCEPAGCPANDPYVATGFNVGMRFALLPGRRVMPWIALGGITTRMETSGLAPPDAGISKLGFGGDATLGFGIGSGGSLSLSPSLSVSSASSELPGGSSLTMRWVSAHLGVTVSF